MNRPSTVLSRRHALVLAGLGLSGLGTGWLAAGCTPAPVADHRRLRPASRGETLREPPVIGSAGGGLEVELVAAPGIELAGVTTSALGYNGSSPGPTLRVRPGDRLRVRLVNRLDRPTNLHTHGLRVSPGGNGDNPFLAVDPGQAFDYTIDVPSDHPVGTFWYHPHHHGTAADQVFGGLAGALVIDRGPELPVAHDRILLVTDTTLLADGTVAAAGPMDRMAGRLGELVLVNGQHQPSTTTTTGTAQLWRVINGCASRTLRLRLGGHQLVQVARDGAFLPAPAELERVVLAPGNRADLVVWPTAAGRFELVTAAAGGSGRATLLTVTAEGPARPAPGLPLRLPAESLPTGPVANTRRVILGMSMGMGMGMRFTIDGRSYDPVRDDQVVRLGTVEEWDIVNTSQLDHPFHLHTWPFTVIADSDGTPPTGTAQDVVLVPAGGWARLRITFDRNPGRSVYHCHILDHEDAGMMATVAVN